MWLHDWRKAYKNGLVLPNINKMHLLFGSSSHKNFTVKRAWLGTILGWVTYREVFRYVRVRTKHAEKTRVGLWGQSVMLKVVWMLQTRYPHCTSTTSRSVSSKLSCYLVLNSLFIQQYERFFSTVNTTMINDQTELVGLNSTNVKCWTQFYFISGK